MGQVMFVVHLCVCVHVHVCTQICMVIDSRLCYFLNTRFQSFHCAVAMSLAPSEVWSFFGILAKSGKRKPENLVTPSPCTWSLLKDKRVFTKQTNVLPLPDLASPLHLIKCPPFFIRPLFVVWCSVRILCCSIYIDIMIICIIHGPVAQLLWFVVSRYLIYFVCSFCMVCRAAKDSDFVLMLGLLSSKFAQLYVHLAHANEGY